MVIPARDVAETIDAQLDALECQTFTGPFEVVLVDNGSTDDTVACALRHDLDLRVVRATDRSGVAYARNVGIAAARADMVLVCDGDDVVSEHWVASMVDALSHDAVVGGPVELEMLNTPALAASRGRNDMSTPLRRGSVAMLPGCNFGLRRELVDRVGPFDEHFDGLEDHEYALRLHAAGVPIGFAPDAVVHYRFRTATRDLVRQGFFYGRSHPLLARRAEELGAPTPPRFEWKGWAWLVVYLPLLFRAEQRCRWFWVAANRWGRVVGSVGVRKIWL